MLSDKHKDSLAECERLLHGTDLYTGLDDWAYTDDYLLRVRAELMVLDEMTK